MDVFKLFLRTTLFVYVCLRSIIMSVRRDSERAWRF